MLKADTRTNSIPVIMVTAKGRPEDMAMARSLGAVEYITKPWKLEEDFKPSIREAIDYYDLRSEHDKLAVEAEQYKG